MRKFAALILFAVAAAGVSAQVTSRNSQYASEESLVERVASIEKKNDWLNIYLNMHGAFDANFNQNGRNGLSEGAFNMRQLRIEAKGNINDWLSYRWRQRLNRSNNGNGMVDNLPNSIDYIGLGIKFNSEFSIFAGKQAAAYGGFEYDANPIEIYQYSEMINNMSNFMTGVTLTYDATSNHQFQFQVLDSRNGSTEETYGANLEDSRLPLLYTVNWNANMFDNLWQTRWSASVMDETKGEYMYYVALGNQFNFSKSVNMYIDFMGSLENVDRKGIMTNIAGKNNGHNAFDAMYGSVVAKVNYRFKPKWNFFVKGMLESASFYKESNGLTKGNYRTSIGYITGLEFYPMETNLHFYLSFFGQNHLFTERAKALGAGDYSIQRVSLGFIYQLPVF